MSDRLSQEGQALQSALERYDQSLYIYATQYAAEHGELPTGFSQCAECGDVLLPEQEHYHAPSPTATDETGHLDHVFCTFCEGQ